MKPRLAPRALLIALTLAAFAGCGRNTPTPPSTPPGNTPEAVTAATGEEVVYAIIPKMLNNPVFTLAQRGAEKAAREVTDTRVKIEYQSSPTGKADEQAEVIRQMTNRGVDGMSISVIDANAVREPINEAVEKGIKVICFDSDAKGSKRTTFFAVDDRKIGQELAEQLIAACGGAGSMSGKIAVLSGQSSAPNLQNRVAGATDILSKLPGVTLLETVYCDDRPEKAIEGIRNVMQANPDLRGWVFVGGWPLFNEGALDSIKDFNRTKVVSVDALPKQLEYLEKGQVACLVAQRCFAWGEESVRILEDLRKGSKTYPEFVDSGYDLVFKEVTPDLRAANARKTEQTPSVGLFGVADYRQQWEKWNQAAP